MTSRTTRAHGTYHNPITPRYVWPTPKARARFMMYYERNGLNLLGHCSSLDNPPDDAILNLGWRAIYKIRCTPK